MDDRMKIATSRNVTITSITVYYILKVFKIDISAYETLHDHRILVMMTGSYLVITFVCLSVGPASKIPKIIHYMVLLFHTPNGGLIDL